MMKHCMLCPRGCGADRVGALGFCQAPAELEVSSISIHKGEEPPISGRKGAVNLFFAHCNLQCLFCQNQDISRGKVASELIRYRTVDEVVERVAELLPQTEQVLGLVSPSHYAHWIGLIVEALHAKGLFPTVVYNTNGYDTVETLREVAPYVDVYLPDFKYMYSDLARRYSHAEDYPQRAQAALMEMYGQMGAGLKTDDTGMAFRGLIVRHLVLPGQVENSLECLRWMAEHLDRRVHVSLMAQYFPPCGGLPDELGRTLREEEYARVVEEFERLGFSRGWVQELSASDSYRPDFSERQSF